MIKNIGPFEWYNLNRFIYKSAILNNQQYIFNINFLIW